MNTDIFFTTNSDNNYLVCIKDNLSLYYGVIEPNIFPTTITQDKYKQVLSSAVQGYKKTFEDLDTTNPQIISFLVNDQTNYSWNIQIKFDNSYFSFEELIKIPLDTKPRDINLVVQEYKEKCKKLELTLSDLEEKYEAKCEQVNKLLTYNNELKRQLIRLSNISPNSRFGPVQPQTQAQTNSLTFIEILANIFQNIAENQRANGN
jgi:hypothetical protein